MKPSSHESSNELRLLLSARQFALQFQTFYIVELIDTVNASFAKTCRRADTDTCDPAHGLRAEIYASVFAFFRSRAT